VMVDELMGRWFEENIVRSVGNGVITFFWTDLWLRDSPLCAV